VGAAAPPQARPRATTPISGRVIQVRLLTSLLL